MNATTRPVRARRSLLFTPALRPDRCAKALDSGADVVCVDLEDAVAPARKAEARAIAMTLFANDTHPHLERMLRINPLSTLDGLKDLQAVIECASPPPALLLPKVRSADELDRKSTRLNSSHVSESRMPSSA